MSKPLVGIIMGVIQITSYECSCNLCVMSLVLIMK